MKTISLLSAILVLPAASLLAQGQSEIEILRSRIDVQERRISQLENSLSRLGGAPAQKAASVQKSTPAKALPAAKKPVASSSVTSEYVVAQGDTLSRIASRKKSTVAAIKKENSLKSDSLRIGQKLKIPASSVVAKQTTTKPEAKKAVASQPAASSKLNSAHYKVVAGDTFYGIARRYKMSEAALKAANPKAVPTRLQIGQVLSVSKDVTPAPAKKAPAVAKKSTPKKSSNSTAKASTKSTTAKTSSTKSTTKKSVAKAPAPSKSPSKTAIRTITVNTQMTYGAFANQHGASTSQLNSLNGLNLSKSTMLAKGSELYVPKQY